MLIWTARELLQGSMPGALHTCQRLAVQEGRGDDQVDVNNVSH
jgi:hypothetical protein